MCLSNGAFCAASLGRLLPNVSGLPNPPSWARHLRLCSSANAVTRQGLGGRSEATGAGNPVLAEEELLPRPPNTAMPLKTPGRPAPLAPPPLNVTPSHPPILNRKSGASMRTLQTLRIRILGRSYHRRLKMKNPKIAATALFTANVAGCRTRRAGRTVCAPSFQQTV